MDDEWARWKAEVDLDEYERRWQRLAEQGAHVHGEADLVASFRPTTVLDAGCGMGRVAVELSRRGITVEGVDVDLDLLERARRAAPHLSWHHDDLARLDLGRRFDAVVLAGNVVGFVRPADRPAALARCAHHVAAGGVLVAGWQQQPGWPQVHDVDGWVAPLVTDARWSSWEREPFEADGGYVVAVWRRPVDLPG